MACTIDWIHKRLKTGGTTEVLPLIYKRDPTSHKLCFYCGLWTAGLHRVYMDYGLQIVGLEEAYKSYGLQTVDYASRGFYRDLGLWRPLGKTIYTNQFIICLVRCNLPLRKIVVS